MFASFDRRHLAGTLLTLTLASASSAAGAAAADKPADYAQVIPLTVSGRQAIVRLPLPQAVYLAARTPDLRDLRVFDASGASMPFALTEPVRQSAERRWQVPVAVFPVHGLVRSAQGLQDRLQIRTGADGAVISVTAPAAQGAAEALDSLVLDLRPSGQAQAGAAAAVSALALTLPPEVHSYSARLLLETSDDLERWDALAEGSVSWLVNSQGARVDRHRIAFAPRAFRYARLRWLDGKPLEFASIAAEYVEQSGAPRQRDSLLLHAVPGPQGRDLVYAAPVAIPVEAIGLQFHANNVVMPALVGQYRKVRGRDGRLEEELAPLLNTSFYQMTQNGQLRMSGDVDVPTTHAAQWVVRPQTAMADQPALRLRWTAASMVFLAGGKGPYTLAVGRADVPSAQVPLSQVAPGFTEQELAALEPARAGTPVLQQVPDADAAGRTPGRAFWLWALLLCGVAALAAMAWRLSRQLKDAPPDADPNS